MSAASVDRWLEAYAPDLAIIDNGTSTATVAAAAAALSVEPGRIAKTLALRAGGEPFLLVARGDARLDNRKAKAAFGGRPRLLDPAETFALTGHEVGGVCPFGLTRPMTICCDETLLIFVSVFPAAGSLTASVEIAPRRLAELVGARWVDTCSLPEREP